MLDPTIELQSEERYAASCVGQLRIAVGIATAGRPGILDQMLARLSAQTRPPDAIVVCAPSAADTEGIADDYPFVTLIAGPRGLTCQRNAILRQLDEFDVAVFFDDDFVPCPDYVAGVEQLMLARPDVVMTTGRVLRDGIRGPGLTFSDADALLRGRTGNRQNGPELQSRSNGYGCNMSVRLAPLRAQGVYFDEGLPLYAWLEDVDFGYRMGRLGPVVMSPGTCGVHLGVKSGRQPGVKLGYSQIANPIYLARKGTCGWGRSLYLISRNLAANAVRSFWPEPWVDRRGRLAGNGRAIIDLISFRLKPDRVRLL